MAFEGLVFLAAGLITGLITGIVGASAVVSFIPLMFIFFDFDAFTLIGMSLLLDVFIALPAFFNYLKYKNVNIKAGIYIIVPALFGVVVGSYFSRYIPNTSLFGFVVLFASLAGISIYRRKKSYEKSGSFAVDLAKRDWLFWVSLVLSLVVGFIGGLIGAAGGLSVLLLLVFIYKFEIHEAIGTSVFIMFFIALLGAIAHFYYIDIKIFSWGLFSLAVVGGVLGSLFSSRVANVISEKKLNKIVGSLLVVLGIATFLYKVVFVNFFS